MVREKSHGVILLGYTGELGCNLGQGEVSRLGCEKCMMEYKS